MLRIIQYLCKIQSFANINGETVTYTISYEIFDTIILYANIAKLVLVIDTGYEISV